jgi:hypothetical protein
MAYQGISTGTTPNDGLGDSLASGAIKINSNFTEIYTALGDGTNLSVTEVIQDAVGSAINAGIQTGISVTYDDTNNRVNFSSYGITTTSTNKSLSNLEYCTVTADSLQLTLPAGAIGNKVTVGVGGNFTNTQVLGNGSNIMGLADNFTIDSPYAVINFIYINSTLGWVIS